MIANISNIKNDLGYEPLLSIEQGLEKTIEWYKG
jgi:nucleoside-diphosphate-sugar epimerase